MQVFNTFFKIVKKQLKSALIYLGIFFVICIMMGSSVKDGVSGFSGKSCNLVVIDNDNSKKSKLLIEYLDSIHNIDEKNDYTEEEIQDRLYYRRMDYVLYINKGYETSGELENIKRSETVIGVYVDNQIAMYESNVNALVAAGYDLDEAHALTLKALDSENLVTKYEGTKDKPAEYNFFNFVPYVLVMIMFNTLAPVLIAFKRKELEDRLSISPLKKISKNLQLTAGTILLGIMCWFLFIVLALATYGTSNIKDMLPLIMVNSLAYTIFCTALVTFVGYLNIKGDMLNVVANIVGLGMSFLGGVFVPMEFFSEGMLKVAKFIPSYWYIKANDVIFDGGKLDSILTFVAVELLFAVAFLAVTLVSTKKLKLVRGN